MEHSVVSFLHQELGDVIFPIEQLLQLGLTPTWTVSPHISKVGSRPVTSPAVSARA